LGWLLYGSSILRTKRTRKNKILFLTVTTGAKAALGIAVALTVLGGIAVWAKWPEEKARMKKRRERREQREKNKKDDITDLAIVTMPLWIDGDSKQDSDSKDSSGSSSDGDSSSSSRDFDLFL